MPNLLRLLKPFPTEPVPEFMPIRWQDIPPASGLIFYGSNDLTATFGNRVYHHPWRPAASHAAIYLGNGDYLNVGAYKTKESIIRSMSVSTHRVDVIRYRMPDGAADEIVKDCLAQISKDRERGPLGLPKPPTYGVLDFVRFGLKWWGPQKQEFCSENYFNTFQRHGVRTSVQESYNTAPWHLVEYANENPSACEMLTLSVGIDFRSKWGS